MNDGFSSSFSKGRVWEAGFSSSGFEIREKDKYHDDHYCILTISDILY